MWAQFGLFPCIGTCMCVLLFDLLQYVYLFWVWLSDRRMEAVPVTSVSFLWRELRNTTPHKEDSWRKLIDRLNMNNYTILMFVCEPNWARSLFWTRNVLLFNIIFLHFLTFCMMSEYRDDCMRCQTNTVARSARLCYTCFSSVLAKLRAFTCSKQDFLCELMFGIYL